MKKLLGLTATGVVALGLVLASASAVAESITLNYAFFAPAQTFPAVQMERWADELEKRTDGQVTVNTFPGGSLLTAENMYDGVLNGVADIGLSATSYEPSRFPLINLAGSITGLDVNSTIASQVAYDLTNRFTAKQLGFGDFKIITAFTSEPGYLHTKTKVDSMEDLQGLVIRSPGDSTKAVEALGAVPVGLTQSETGEALQTGIVDGYVGSREAMMDFQYARNIKYLTNYPMSNVVFVAAMNKQRWDSLPSNVQKVINELGSEMAYFTGDYLDKHIQKSIEWAKAEQGLQVVNLSNAEKKRWQEKLEPLNKMRIQQLINAGLPAQEFYKEMQELIEMHQE